MGADLFILSRKAFETRSGAVESLGRERFEIESLALEPFGCCKISNFVLAVSLIRIAISLTNYLKFEVKVSKRTLVLTLLFVLNGHD